MLREKMLGKEEKGWGRKRKENIKTI